MNFQIFPEQASTFAPRVDLLYYALTGLSTLLTAAIFLAIIYFGAKYRKKPGEDRLSENLEHPVLEITWTVVPFFVVIGIFFWGALLYAEYLNTPEEGAVEIDVVGKQWMWTIQHPNGKATRNQLYVPKDVPVVLTLTSEDVLHSFYIPAFRVKQDTIPGRFQRMWFQATKAGEFPIFCAEYCGTEHSYMIGTVTVMEQNEYTEWLQRGPAQTPIETGEYLFSQVGCIECHNPASGARGPDLAGIYGSTGRLVSGQVVEKDENYLQMSLLEPNRQIAEGYQPLMPSFRNRLTDDEVRNLIAYMKSLPPAGETD